MITRSRYNSIMSLKSLLKSLIGIFLFFTAGIAWAAFPFDTFDSYEAGHQLNEYANWASSNADWLIMTGAGCFSGNCIISTSSTQPTKQAIAQVNATSGAFSLEVMLENAYTMKDITLRNADYQYPVWFYFQGWSATSTTYSMMTGGGGFPEDAIFTDLAINVWHKISIDWTCNGTGTPATARFRLENGIWTDWIDQVNYYCADTKPITNIIIGNNVAENSFFAIDEIGSATSSLPVCGNVGYCDLCDYWQCLGFSDVCCWNMGECVEGACVIQGGTCGAGSNLFFCNTQAECENFSGYWYEDYCWQFPLSEEFDWFVYCAEHCENGTSSAMVNGIATLFNEFYRTIGGFVAGYQNFFDISVAAVKGDQFGSAIPVSRGYLKIIDDFLCIAPTIDSLYVFSLLVFVAVAIFNLVKGVIAIIKIF